jgi:hypothetical protein
MINNFNYRQIRKKIGRIIYRKGKEFSIELDALKYIHCQNLKDDLEALQYRFCKDGWIEVMEADGKTYWKLTQKAIEQTYNDGVDVSKFTIDELRLIVQKAYDDSIKDNAFVKNAISGELDEYQQNEHLDKLKEWENNARKNYDDNHRIMDSWKGAENVLGVLSLAPLHNAQIVLYSGLGQSINTDLPPSQKLYHYLKNEFEMWYFVRVHQELIEELTKKDDSKAEGKHPKTKKKEKDYYDYTDKYIKLRKSANPFFNREQAIEKVMSEFKISDRTLGRALDANSATMEKYGFGRKENKKQKFRFVKW